MRRKPASTRPPGLRRDRRAPACNPDRTPPSRDEVAHPHAAHAEAPDPEPAPAPTWDDRAG